jgi:hypothetical protein
VVIWHPKGYSHESAIQSQSSLPCCRHSHPVSDETLLDWWSCERGLVGEGRKEQEEQVRAGSCLAPFSQFLTDLYDSSEPK